MMYSDFISGMWCNNCGTKYLLSCPKHHHAGYQYSAPPLEVPTWIKYKLDLLNVFLVHHASFLQCVRKKIVVFFNPPFTQSAETHLLLNRFTFPNAGFHLFTLWRRGCSIEIKLLTSLLSGLDSDESYEGVSESSFKDALVFDGSSQKNNGSVPQQNGIKKHRFCRIPALYICVLGRLCDFTSRDVSPQTESETFIVGISTFSKQKKTGDSALLLKCRLQKRKF